MSLILIFLLPGDALLKILLKKRIIDSSGKGFLDYLQLSIFLSFLISFPIIAICLSLYLISFIALTILFPFLVIVLDVWDILIRNRKTPNSTKWRDSLRVTLSQSSIPNILLILIFGILFASFRLSFFPDPLIPGTDTLSHLAVINNIIYSGGSSNLFGANPYIFHGYVAVSCILSGLSPLWVIKYGSIFVYPVTLIFIFLLLNRFIHNEAFSTVAVLASASIFEFGGLLATYRVYPVTMSFFVLTLIYVTTFQYPKSHPLTLLLIVGYIFSIFIYPNAIFVSVPLFLYLLSQRTGVSHIISEISWILMGIISMGGIILIFLFSYILPVLGIGIPEIEILPSMVITDNLAASISMFSAAYSLSDRLLLVLGILSIGLCSVRKSSYLEDYFQQKHLRFIACLSLTYLVVFFAPLGFGYRTEMFFRQFNLLMICFGALFLFRAIKPIIVRIDPTHPMASNLITEKEVVTSFVIIIVVFASAVTSAEVAVYFAYGEPKYMNETEWNAFQWLENHTEIDDYILTDMTTGYIMRGVILRNASTSFILNGNSVSPFDYPDLQLLIFDFLNSANYTSAMIFYHQIQNTLLSDQFASGINYILISWRTMEWLRLARVNRFVRSANYWKSLQDTDPAWVKFFDGGFDCVYSDGTLFILRVPSNSSQINISGNF